MATEARPLVEEERTEEAAEYRGGDAPRARTRDLTERYEELERKIRGEREAPEKTSSVSDLRSDPKAEGERKGAAQKERKSTASGSQSAARSQSPTVMKIDGPEPERSSVAAREPREVVDPTGEQRYRGELSEDYVKFPRTLRVMPWNR